MNTSRLGRGEMIAAVSAIALLLIMFILNWFGIGGELGAIAEAADVDTGANAWQSFGFIDIVLFITILVAVGLAVMKANSQSPNLPVAGSAIVTGLGILSVLLILYRIIDTPYDADREIGVFLGLLAAAGIAYGGYESMKEEGTTFQGQADRLQNRDSTTGTGGTTGTTPPPPAPRDPGNNPPSPPPPAH